MNLDLYLLNQTIQRNDILFTLRFYFWEGNHLSIGYHQKNLPSHWYALEKEGLIKIIKRPSGGGAVLHSGGITYALTFKKPTYKKFSYEIINTWLIKSFSEIGLILNKGTNKKALLNDNCFSSSITSDLIDKKGYKRIGSAQLWKKDSFLQHGEIQLNPPNELWSKIFNAQPPPPLELELCKKGIIKHLTKSFLNNNANEYLENIYLNYEDIKKDPKLENLK